MPPQEQAYDGAQRLGLASRDLGELADRTLGAWDDFLDLIETADLDRPSRLPGWRGRDVLAHLGSWPGQEVLDGVLDSARSGGAGTPVDPDAGNAAVVAAHRDDPLPEVITALVRARDRLEHFYDSGEALRWGQTPTMSAVGPLPVLAVVCGGSYELAVHALDLVPCDAAPPGERLLQAGLAALMDITGALCTRHDVQIVVTAQTPAGGWRFAADASGWETAPVPPGEVPGTAVLGTATTLLDVSAGRLALPVALLSRRLRVQALASFMRLAPLVEQVPGLPGGPALRRTAGSVGRIAAMVPGLRR